VKAEAARSLPYHATVPAQAALLGYSSKKTAPPPPASCGVGVARERQHQTVPGHSDAKQRGSTLPGFFTAGPARLAGRWPAMMPCGQRQREALFLPFGPRRCSAPVTSRWLLLLL